MLSLYMEGPKVEVQRVSNGTAEIALNALEGCTRLIWDEILGGMQALVESTGSRNVYVAWRVPPHAGTGTSAVVVLAWS